MEDLWIIITVVTAFLQAVRTAAQKDLNKHLSTMAVTYVRSLFGLPLIVALLAVTLTAEGRLLPYPFDGFFLLMCLIGAVGQMLATALLVHLFTLRNFAVSSVLPKSELIFIAVLGAMLFSERLSLPGWTGILLTLAGVVVVSIGRIKPGALAAGGGGWRENLLGRSTQVGLLSGLLFAICTLAMREAILHIDAGSAYFRGGWVLLVVIVMQIALQSVWFLWSEPDVWRKIAGHTKACTFIGMASGLGSFGWMVAFGMQNASYVRAVGQVEIAFTLLLSWLYFRERIGRLEILGIGLILAGVLVFRLYA